MFLGIDFLRAHDAQISCEAGTVSMRIKGVENEIQMFRLSMWCQLAGYGFHHTLLK